MCGYDFLFYYYNNIVHVYNYDLRFKVIIIVWQLILVGREDKVDYLLAFTCHRVLWTTI